MKTPRTPEALGYITQEKIYTVTCPGCGKKYSFDMNMVAEYDSDTFPCDKCQTEIEICEYSENVVTCELCGESYLKDGEKEDCPYCAEDNAKGERTPRMAVQTGNPFVDEMIAESLSQ